MIIILLEMIKAYLGSNYASLSIMKLMFIFQEKLPQQSINSGSFQYLIDSHVHKERYQEQWL